MRDRIWRGREQCHVVQRVRKLLSTTSHVTLVRLHNGAICMPCALHAARQQAARAFRLTQMLSTTHSCQAVHHTCPPTLFSTAGAQVHAPGVLHAGFLVSARWLSQSEGAHLVGKEAGGGDGGSSGRGCPKAFRPGTSGTLRSADC